MSQKTAIRTAATFLALAILASNAPAAEWKEKVLYTSSGWKEKVLYSFQGGTDGAYPAGGVVFDAAGNLYGATYDGGANNCPGIAECGTVYQLSPPKQQGGSWTETILYVFKGKNFNDGSTPGGGVLIDKAGNLYGSTSYGGSGSCVLLGTKTGCGMVFKLSPPKVKGGAWTETILYSFKGGKDGYVPVGDLTFDSAGNLYGATLFGGGKGTTCDPYYQYCGTVFELGPPKTKGGAWTEKVLHSFAGGTDGANPNGGLVLDSKGEIYGTTYGGGNEGGECGSLGCGTVFKLAPPTVKGRPWTEELLDRFNPVNSGAAEPAAGVIFDRGGDLYGTTVGGGNSGSGTVFRLARSNGKWIERVLYRFRDDTDGGEPRSGLVFDAAGNLYGTATGGGTVGNGTLFQLRPTGDSWSFTPLYSFAVRPDGAYPTGLILDRTGNIYGTTQYGGNGRTCGNYGCGTVLMAKP
jgi:uncharacterized repeat protein (TIGR03803 family)